MEVDQEKLVIFNLKENTQRIISFHDYSNNVIAYVESSIFPKANGLKENKRKRF